MSLDNKIMKFLIVGDLHGNVPEIHFKNFDAIIAPGDFCSDTARKYMFDAIRINQEAKKNGSKKEIDWYDLVGKKKAKQMVEKSLSDGRKILEKLNSFDVPVYIVPGNWDWTDQKDEKWEFLRKGHYDVLIRGLQNVFDCHAKRINAGEFYIIGHGITSGPEYPVHNDLIKTFTKKELQQKKRKFNIIYKRVEKLFRTDRPVIFLTHNVPYNTKLDMITNRDSPKYGYHYGSVLARKIVDEKQPLVCIGGHMHEHFTKQKLGRTVCINAGFGSYVNILMELNGNRITNLKFYQATK